MNYLNYLRLLNILPLPMFLQLSDVLLLVKLIKDDNCDLVLPEILDEESRQHEIFKLPKRRTERAQSEFVFRTCRVINRWVNFATLSD